MLVPVTRYRFCETLEEFIEETILLPPWQALAPGPLPPTLGGESAAELEANLRHHNGRCLFFDARRFLEQLDRYGHAPLEIPETRAMLALVRDEVARRLEGGAAHG